MSAGWKLQGCEFKETKVARRGDAYPLQRGNCSAAPGIPKCPSNCTLPWFHSRGLGLQGLGQKGHADQGQLSAAPNKCRISVRTQLCKDLE